MSGSSPLDSLGRRRSPAAVPGYLAGRPPRTKGRRYPADPPRTEEIIAVRRCMGTFATGRSLAVPRVEELVGTQYGSGRARLTLHRQRRYSNFLGVAPGRD